MTGQGGGAKDLTVAPGELVAMPAFSAILEPVTVRSGGRFHAVVYRNDVDGYEHIALVKGRISAAKPAPASVISCHDFSWHEVI